MRALEPPTASRRPPAGWRNFVARRSDRLDTIVSLSKRRGIVFPSSEIYGGLPAATDYGPLGVGMKNKNKRPWGRSQATDTDETPGLIFSGIPPPQRCRGAGPPTP